MVQLTLAIKFIYEERVLHSKNDNIGIKLVWKHQGNQ